MLENCGASGLPKLSRDFLNQFLCCRVDGCFFYRNACLNEKCSECGAYPSLTHVSMKGVNKILRRQ